MVPTLWQQYGKNHIWVGYTVYLESAIQDKMNEKSHFLRLLSGATEKIEYPFKTAHAIWVGDTGQSSDVCGRGQIVVVAVV